MEEASSDSQFGNPIERRKLRKEQRELHDTLLENREKISEVGSSLFTDLREQNNQLFKKAKHAREQFNDALNLKEIAKAATSQVLNLDDMSRRYDFESWADAVKHKYENPEDHIFSWTSFGMDCGTLFLSAPKVCPLLGVLKNELKKRGPIVRNPRAERAVESKPEEQEEDGEIAEATNTRILTLWEFLQGEHGRLSQLSLSQSQEQGLSAQDIKPSTINILTALVDPNDNVQTIENFFDYSFLIKDKRVVETLDEEGIPVTMTVAESEEKGAEDGKKQMVLSLSMNDLKELAKLLPTGYVCPLHRDDPLYEAKDARQQADILAERLENEEKLKKMKKKNAIPPVSNAQGKSKSKRRIADERDDDDDEEEESRPTQRRLLSSSKKS